MGKSGDMTVGEEERGETLARLMQAYVDDSVMLSDREKAMYERLVEADALTKDYNYPSATARAEVLARKFRVSMATARRDLQAAAELFNNLEPLDAATCARVILSQVDKFLVMCEELKDMRSAAAFMKIKDAVRADLRTRTIDPKMLRQNNYTFVINGRMRGMAVDVTPEAVERKLRAMGLGLSEGEIRALVDEVPYEPVDQNGGGDE